MLGDLNKLALEAKKRSDNYDKNEFVFSKEFKLKFVELRLKDNIKFYDYTSVVTTKKDLLIIVPNQWFVLGSFFTEYVTEIRNYKSIADELRIDKNTIGSIRNNKLIDESTEILIVEKFSNVEDAAKFRKFLTDYDWWFGSKTIDRADYFVSAVLSLAGVIHNSQSYIADLAYLLSQHPEMNTLLQKDYQSYLNQGVLQPALIEPLIEEPLVEEPLIEENNLRNLVFKSFKYILETFGEENVIRGHVIKPSAIEGRVYRGLTIPHFFGFENIIALFDESQNLENLKSSITKRYFEEPISILNNEFSYFTTQWNFDKRGLQLESFNNYLAFVSGNTLQIIKVGNMYQLIKKTINKSPLKIAKNEIYYGSPGTGKSYKITERLSSLDFKFFERITFHPEYDNACFVGGYKPISEIVEYTNHKDEFLVKDEIKYKFVPQVFTNIYINAWNDLSNQYYLVIEEINRGNCAEIFGDIFQLLDRNSGYTVAPSNELQKHIVEELGNQHEGIKNGLKLPPNLSILATMNTSDQSLFPMDSAFKRRWDWEFIPICYDITEKNKSSNYFVTVDKKHNFIWIDFIKAVNHKIKMNRNLGSDKCVGNYFIKPENNEISLKEFINKVIFYLWNDVFKDEDQADSIFKDGIHYEDFFPIETKGKELVLEILKTDDFNNVLNIVSDKEEVLS
ncbi:McrB family protein [Flavobacterium sp. ZS1P14]|uniref:McrB family protein n=1 Tax=Flavobacterium sp. ZS1P14 TaxID=3401729 RepID=UPI003AABAEA2